MASDQALMRSTACAIVDKLNAGEVSPHDLLDALEKRIAEVDGTVNALPTLCFERARDAGRGADAEAAPASAACLRACRCRSRTSPMSRAC